MQAKKYRQETGWEIIQSLFRNKECTKHILNITIPEIVGAFVRWELKGEIKRGQWKELKNLFIEDIRNYQVVIHNISDRNIIRTDDVWEISIPIKAAQSQEEEKNECPYCHKEITTYSHRRKPRIGPIDVMVLSVGLELKTIYGHNNVYIFTSDNHMLKVADRLKIKTCDPESVEQLPFLPSLP